MWFVLPDLVLHLLLLLILQIRLLVNGDRIDHRRCIEGTGTGGEVRLSFPLTIKVPLQFIRDNELLFLLAVIPNIEGEIWSGDAGTPSTTLRLVHEKTPHADGACGAEGVLQITGACANCRLGATSTPLDQGEESWLTPSQAVAHWQLPRLGNGSRTLPGCRFS